MEPTWVRTLRLTLAGAPLRFSPGSRLFRRLAHLVRRLSAVHGRSSKVQPHREGHRLHPKELWEPDGPQGSSGRAGPTSKDPLWSCWRAHERLCLLTFSSFTLYFCRSGRILAASCCRWMWTVMDTPMFSWWRHLCTTARAGREGRFTSTA